MKRILTVAVFLLGAALSAAAQTGSPGPFA